MTHRYCDKCGYMKFILRDDNGEKYYGIFCDSCGHRIGGWEDVKAK